MPRMRPMVITRKYYSQLPLSVIAAGGVININFVDSVAVLAKNTPVEVEEGSRVSAIYFEIWIKTNDAAAGTAVGIIEKQIASSVDPAAGNMGALDTYPNKKNILFTFMGLTNPALGVSMPMIKGWLKIPKSKARMGLGDKIVMSIFSQTGTLQVCGFCTYKEQM